MLKRRILMFFCVAALLVGVVVPKPLMAHAADSGKTIAVVYDNSGSMYADNANQPIDRWSQALYALEVFTSMLEENDSMMLYPLNPSDAGAVVTVKGNQDPEKRISETVQALNQATESGSGSTPYAQVGHAAADLAGISGEKWLVVLTDGDFNERYNAFRLQEMFLDYCLDDIGVVFLSVNGGADLTQFTDPEIGLYAYRSMDGPDVLSKVAQIANIIFSQQILPANHITTNGNQMILDIDIPVSRLMVLTQGDDAEIISLSKDSQALTPSSQAKPEVTEENIPRNWVGGTLVGEELKGHIHSYTGHNDPGEYVLEVTNTNNVQVFYIADVELDCILKDEFGALSSTDQHYEGTYELEWSFVDQNHVSYTSDLLNIVNATGTLTNITTGDELQLDMNTTSVTLKEGEYELSAAVLLAGTDVPITCLHKYVVAPPVIPLKFQVLSQPASYMTAGLGKDASPILIKVINGKTGDELTEAQWKAMDLTVTGGNLDYLVDKGSAVSTFEIRPTCPKGQEASKLAGDNITLTMEGSFSVGSDEGYGKDTDNISLLLIATETLEMKVLLTPPSTVIDLGIFTAQKEDGQLSIDMELNDEAAEEAATEMATGDGYIRMDITAKNPFTAAFGELTGAQRRSLKLTLIGVDENKKEFTWSATYNNDGFWEVRPNYAQIIKYSWDNVDWSNPKEGKEIVVAVKATAEIEEDGFLYLGSDGPVGVTVRTMSLVDLISQIIGWVIGTVAGIFLICGYLFKKKLKLKKKKAALHSVRPAGNMHSVAPQRVWATYLLPYVPQRARFNAKNKAQNCNFPELLIEATDRRGAFRVVNYESLLSAHNGKTTLLVSGQEYRKSEEKERTKLKEKVFGSITLEYKDLSTGKKGEFKIS